MQQEPSISQPDLQLKNSQFLTHPTLKQRMPLLNPEYPNGYDPLFMQIKQRICNENFSVETNQMIQKLLLEGQTNYTCWIAKKLILKSNGSTIQHEDDYSIELLLDGNTKNFQLWDYRNFIYENTKNHQKQYALMDKVLKSSPKNYHLWSNRTRLVSSVKNYAEEIQRTEIFIINDFYNNSAWAYRAFCFKNLAAKNFKEEIEYTIGKIRIRVDNEAAWNYLRGMFPAYKLKKIPSNNNQKDLLKYNDYPEIQNFCKEIIDSNEGIMKSQALITLLTIQSQSKQTVEYAKQICDFLGQIQPLRVNFYQWLKAAL